jgi:histidinol-phosphate aminotransferase
MIDTPTVDNKEILKIKAYTPGTSRLEGIDNPIKLSSNENPFGASPKAFTALEKSLRSLHRYPDGGCQALREALAKKHNLDADNIVCGAGSDELISLLCDAYAGANTEVLYSQYGFLMYPIATLKAGGKPVVAREKDHRTDIHAVLKKVTDKTRLVFIANPNNPTGSYISKQELEELRDKLPDRIILVVDCAYAEYVAEKDYSDGLDIAKHFDNMVVLRTFSKIYGLAALRLGWGYFPKDIADIMNRVRGPFNVSSQAQIAGTAALEDNAFIKKSVAHNDKERAWLKKELEELGLKVFPSVANFLLVEFPKDKRRSAQSANSFLHTRGIIGRAMTSYGLPECMRLTIGLEEENRALRDALKEFLVR